jgi:hypothetical protein
MIAQHLLSKSNATPKPRGEPSRNLWLLTVFVWAAALACKPAAGPAPSPAAAEQLACARDLLVSAGFTINATPAEGLRAMRVRTDRFDEVTVWSRRPGKQSSSSLTVDAQSGTVEGTGEGERRLYLNQLGPSLEAGQLRDAIRDSCGVCTRGADGLTRACT